MKGRPALEVADIFRAHGPAWREAQRGHLSLAQLRVMSAIEQCRSAALGGHVLRCEGCGVDQVAYNSCRHRSCPQCAGLERERWLAGWQARLLDCPHHHVVFTVPHDLLWLWRYNKRLFADALFWAASQALLELLADEQYLGARPGLLAALHTWGQTLCEHVHLHVLVTAGGLTPYGRWKRTTRSCLLPRQVLMVKFRGKLRCRLLRLLNQGRLKLPPGTSESHARGQLNKLGRTTCSVKILERYAHGRGVATYLARYLKGGPLPPQRLLSCRDGVVRFSYRDNRDPDDESGRGKRKVMSLPADEFLARWLEHVPPPNLQTVRAYGLYAACKREELAVARQHLGQPPLPAEPKKMSWQEFCVRLGRSKEAYCPVCGEELQILATFQRGRDPPQPYGTSSRGPEHEAA